MSTVINDIVVDASVMCLFGSRSCDEYHHFFYWLIEKGHLTVSQKLLVEYYGSGNRQVAVLLNRLIAGSRLVKIQSKELKAFKEDRHFSYTCNDKDIQHVRLVCLSIRKLLVSKDKNLVNDVNKFRKISRIKPKACVVPAKEFYDNIT